MNSLFAVLVGLAIFVVRLNAAEPHAKAPPADVYAVLEAHCVKCHGGEKTKGGLDLVTREALLRGGESGAAVLPGKPDASLLIRQVRHEEDPHMPHKEPKLPDAAIAQLVEWVKAGVPYARPLAKTPQPGAGKDAAKFMLTDADRSHWAFQPIRRPTPPEVQSSKFKIPSTVSLSRSSMPRASRSRRLRAAKSSSAAFFWISSACRRRRRKWMRSSNPQSAIRNPQSSPS